MFKITNGNETTFIGRFNGQDYAFPSGEAVYCPDDAASHIFGLGNHDKTAVLARNAWATPSVPYAVGMATLNRFSFQHMSPTFDAPLAIVEPVKPDYGPAPVDRDALAGKGGTDGLPKSVGAVEVAARVSRGNPSGRLPPAV